MATDEQLESSSSKRKSGKSAGRAPEFTLDDKQDICYRLYVEEQKSIDDICAYLSAQYLTDAAHLPSKKIILEQFQQWNFPNTVQQDADEARDAKAGARIRELWKQNVNQKDIKAMMEQEGWNLRTYEFTKLWRKEGLRLRNENGYKTPDAQPKKRKRGSATPAEPEAEQQGQDSVTDAHITGPDPISEPMDEEEAAARAQRLLDIQLESDARFQARKRRRRIRGYGHLPPDPKDTAPRYASETSLDECKAYLDLTNEMYVQIRKEYTAICESMEILKKTECGDKVWEDSKQKLIRENPHLNKLMGHDTETEAMAKMKVALECLAADVTKRMRVTGRSITIADANNLLDLNPTESKAVRRAFYEILAADKFESRLVSGEDHWNDLRQMWFRTSDKLQQVIAENDPKKIRAVDLLGRDTMKRFREDRNSRGERVVVQQNAVYGPGPGPAWAAKAPRAKRKPVMKHPELIDPSAADSSLANARSGMLQQPVAQMSAAPHDLSALSAADEKYDYANQPINENLMAQLAQATNETMNFDLDPALADATAFPAS